MARAGRAAPFRRAKFGEFNDMGVLSLVPGLIGGEPFAVVVNAQGFLREIEVDLGMEVAGI